MAVSTCSACGEVFYSVSGFDAHRVGSFGEAIYGERKQGKSRGLVVGYTKSNRRCLTHDEMRAAGMTKNARGQWITETFDSAKEHMRAEAAD